MAYANFNLIRLYTRSPYNVDSTAYVLLTLTDELANVTTSNELSYNSSPTRANDMTLTNDEEAFYVPTVEMTFAYLSPENYSTLMQMANSKGFVVEYFDQELGETVFRAMYVSEKGMERLHNYGSSLDGLCGVKVKMVSRYGYAYTPASDSHCTAANKLHMYQLHLHRHSSDYNPTGDPAVSRDPDYV